MATLILGAAAIYALIGVIVAAPFALRVVRRFDRGAAHAPIGFSLLIFPGCMALWPIVLRWWRRANHPQRASEHDSGHGAAASSASHSSPSKGAPS